MNAPRPLLSLQHASKAFGAIHALEDVSIDLLAGEAHALVGENGAGKSTLVKILGGVHLPDSGGLSIDGQEVVLSGPAAARDAGVAIIYQEPIMFPDLTVAENIALGLEPAGWWRPVRWQPPSAGWSHWQTSPARAITPATRSLTACTTPVDCIWAMQSKSPTPSPRRCRPGHALCIC